MGATPPNGFELSKNPPQVPRSVRGGCGGKLPGGSGQLSLTLRHANTPGKLQSGSAEGPAEGPAHKAGVPLQGFSELLGGALSRDLSFETCKPHDEAHGSEEQSRPMRIERRCDPYDRQPAR